MGKYMVATGGVVGGKERITRFDANLLKSDYNIICDGGCQGNPGRMYGSYRIETRNGRSRIERVEDLGYGTNNEAEYRTLLTALQDILRRCQLANVPSEEFTVAVQCDSQLVVKQINGEWDIKSESLMPWFEAIHDELTNFKSWTLTWLPRAEVVKILGH